MVVTAVTMAVIARVIMPVIAVAIPIRQADHASHTADNATHCRSHRAADDTADRPSYPASGGRAAGRSPDNALGLPRNGKSETGDDCRELQICPDHWNISH
jgi:hypothetical protein